MFHTANFRLVFDVGMVGIVGEVFGNTKKEENVTEHVTV